MDLQMCVKFPMCHKSCHTIDVGDTNFCFMKIRSEPVKLLSSVTEELKPSPMTSVTVTLKAEHSMAGTISEAAGR